MAWFFILATKNLHSAYSHQFHCFIQAIKHKQRQQTGMVINNLLSQTTTNCQVANIYLNYHARQKVICYVRQHPTMCYLSAIDKEVQHS